MGRQGPHECRDPADPGARAMSAHGPARDRAATVSPELALARLVLAGVSPEQVAAQLAEAGQRGLARVAAEKREALARLQLMVEQSRVDHAVTAIDEIRAMFERAVAICPEATVAAYSLGDASVLAE